jgi:hypothetical protein
MPMPPEDLSVSGLLRNPVVPAFLECPLEFGVGGAYRVISCPMGLNGTGKRR